MSNKGIEETTTLPESPTLGELAALVEKPTINDVINLGPLSPYAQEIQTCISLLVIFLVVRFWLKYCDAYNVVIRKLARKLNSK